MELPRTFLSQGIGQGPLAGGTAPPYATRHAGPPTRAVVNRRRREGLPARDAECENAPPLIQQIPVFLGAFAGRRKPLAHAPSRAEGQHDRWRGGRQLPGGGPCVWRVALGTGRLPASAELLCRGGRRRSQSSSSPTRHINKEVGRILIPGLTLPNSQSRQAMRPNKPDLRHDSCLHQGWAGEV